MKEKSYMIIGIRSEKGEKRLELRPLDDIIQKKEKLSPMDALKDIGGLVQKTQEMYSKGKTIDIVRVSDEDFKERHLEIDGYFTISY